MQRLLMVTGLLLFTTAAALAQLRTVNVKGGERVDAIAITVTRFGPYPTSIERPEGPFLLFIVNRSGALEDTFSLVPKSTEETGAAPSLLDLHSTRSNQRDHQVIDPAPGDYQLLFKSHPDWTVEITISK